MRCEAPGGRFPSGAAAGPAWGAGLGRERALTGPGELPAACPLLWGLARLLGFTQDGQRSLEVGVAEEVPRTPGRCRDNPRLSLPAVIPGGEGT